MSPSHSRKERVGSCPAGSLTGVKGRVLDGEDSMYVVSPSLIRRGLCVLHLHCPSGICSSAIFELSPSEDIAPLNCVKPHSDATETY